MTSMSPESLNRLRTMAAQCTPAGQIATALGVSRPTILKWARIGGIKLHVPVGHPPIVAVPGWVKAAGLVAVFLDTALNADEFAAAAHCRRLKREGERAA